MIKDLSTFPPQMRVELWKKQNKTLLLGKKGGWGKLMKIISHREKVKSSFIHKTNGRLKAGEVDRLPG